MASCCVSTSPPYIALLPALHLILLRCVHYEQREMGYATASWPHSCQCSTQASHVTPASSHLPCTLRCTSNPRCTIRSKTCFVWFQVSARRGIPDPDAAHERCKLELGSRDQTRLHALRRAGMPALISGISSSTYVPCFLATGRFAYNRALPSLPSVITYNSEQKHKRNYIIPA